MIRRLELLDELDRRRAADPLKYVEQHDKQQDASSAMHAVRALFWGNRVGKTEWGAQEVAKYLLGRHPHRTIRQPCEVWAACPSYDTQEETTQKKLLRYTPESEIAHVSYISGRIIKKLSLKNGSLITFKSYEQGREKFQGAGKRLIWFDEEPPHDIWEECFVRVEAGVPLDVILTMTAIKGMTWVYDEIYLATDRSDLYVSEAGWDDNPWLTEEQKQQMARGLSAQALKVRREGKFVKRVGLVCNWWDRSKHLKHYTELDRTWNWYEAFDGGYSDPAAYLLIGVDNDNNVHVVDGFRKKLLSPVRIAELRQVKRGQLLITQGFTDNDDPRLAAQLGGLGMPLTPVEKEPGENASWDETLAMKLDEYGHIQPGTGEPRLFISDSLIETDERTGKPHNWMVQEIENLVWLEKVDKQGEQIQPKWDDHRRYGHHFDGMRALSYMLVSYIKKPKPFKQSRNRQTGINLGV
jgi:phage terminase large subunit-like protein